MHTVLLTLWVWPTRGWVNCTGASRLSTEAYSHLAHIDLCYYRRHLVRVIHGGGVKWRNIYLLFVLCICWMECAWTLHMIMHILLIALWICIITIFIYWFTWYNDCESNFYECINSCWDYCFKFVTAFVFYGLGWNIYEFFFGSAPIYPILYITFLCWNVLLRK